MKLVPKLLAAAVVAVIAIMFDRRRRNRFDRSLGRSLGRSFGRPDLDHRVGSDFGDPGSSADADVVDAEIIAGIADVDPEPLSQVSGEGIDRDATEAAHTDIEEQRDRLPRGSKDVP